MLATQGASLLEIADVLGHKTLAMVKRYSHLVVDHKAKVIEKLVAAKGLWTERSREHAAEGTVHLRRRNHFRAAWI